MAISLSKGGNVNLSKATPSLKSVNVGLGWDVRTTTGADFDLDASAILVGTDGRVGSTAGGDSNFVFFNNPSSPDGSVKTAGDNLTGAGSGADETISVDLQSVPADVDRIVFVISIYDAEARGNQSFGHVRNCFSAVANSDTNEELARYDLTEDASTETSMVISELYRAGNDWKFRAVGQGYVDGLSGVARDYGVTV